MDYQRKYFLTIIHPLRFPRTASPKAARRRSWAARWSCTTRRSSAWGTSPSSAAGTHAVTRVPATRVLAQVWLHDDGVPGVLVRQWRLLVPGLGPGLLLPLLQLPGRHHPRHHQPGPLLLQPRPDRHLHLLRGEPSPGHQATTSSTSSVQGFRLEGKPVLTCGKDGGWDAVLPRCVAKKV